MNRKDFGEVQKKLNSLFHKAQKPKTIHQDSLPLSIIQNMKQNADKGKEIIA